MTITVSSPISRSSSLSFQNHLPSVDLCIQRPLSWEALAVTTVSFCKDETIMLLHMTQMHSLQSSM